MTETVKIIVEFWKRSLDKAIEYKESSDDILLSVKGDDFEIEEIDD